MNVKKQNRRLLGGLTLAIGLTVGWGIHSRADVTGMGPWYAQPAQEWEKQALPIGNGSMGGMIFGGVDYEHIQFNHDTLWTGDDQVRGDFQPFGDLFVVLADEVVAFPRYVYKRPAHLSEIGHARDGDPDTYFNERFSVEAEPIPLLFGYARPAAVRSYALTAPNQGNGRHMPSAWEFQGSNDEETWITLDEQRFEENPWEEGAQRIAFDVENEEAFRWYRLVFHPVQEVTDFDRERRRHPEQIQIAHIEIGEESPSAYSGYTRHLNIEEGVHRVSYTSEGAVLRREAFSSNPDEVMVIRFSSDQPGRYSGAVLFRDARGRPLSIEGNRMRFAGNLEDNGLRYEAQLHLVAEGGTLTKEDDRVLFEDVDELRLMLNVDTEYVPDIERNWRGEDPHEAVTARLDRALRMPVEDLRDRHVRDHRALFDRASFRVGPEHDPLAGIPTDRRLAAYQDGGADLGLESMLFQMGRYLLIASSRPGALPANLQGLWNNRLQPAWGSDYHFNINIQMSYWLGMTANLPELHRPYIDYIQSQIPAYRNRLREAYEQEIRNQDGTVRFPTLPRGWTVRTNGNPFGATRYRWCETANAWHMQHFWEQFAFTEDMDFLRNVAYPAMREVCHYWEDRLVEREDGTLVVPKGWSPEHGPEEDGVTYDQMLVWDLFRNFVEASKVLDEDPEYRARIADMKDRLLALQIGSWGQLQEWAVDRDDPDNDHRHFSHLFGVHPGRQISPLATPELAEAAGVSLRARETAMAKHPQYPWFWNHTGWSKTWRIAIWSRLFDRERTYDMVRELIEHRIYDNMLSTCPPIVLDAGLGLTAAYIEMLMQSHNRTPYKEVRMENELTPWEIHLLPTLPQTWTEGEARGLRARGGFEIDLVWDDHEIREVRVTSLAGNPCVIRSETALNVEGVTAQELDDNVMVFPTEAGITYVLRP